MSLLLEHTDLREEMYGETALHLAVRSPRCAEAVDFLVNAGAPLLVKDGYGNTPLMLALSLYDHSYAQQEGIPTWQREINSNKLLYAEQMLNKLRYSQLWLLEEENQAGQCPLEYARANHPEIYRQMQRRLNPPPPRNSLDIGGRKRSRAREAESDYREEKRARVEDESRGGRKRSRAREAERDHREEKRARVQVPLALALRP
jgi:hypothetical protein